MNQRKKAIVVGSGIAGLTAAHELEKSGWDAIVLERNAFAGGRMANVRCGNMLLETGATEIFSFYKDLLLLVEECGLTDQLVEADVYRCFRIKNNGKEYDFDYGATLLALLMSKALSTASKLRLPALMPDIARFKKNVDPCLIDSAAEYDDMDLQTYLTKKVGRDFSDGFIAPLFRLFWRWQPDAFSRAYFLAFIAHSLGSKIYTFRNGVGTLTQALAERLPVRYNCEVVSVSPTFGGSVRVEYSAPQGDIVEECDVVVMATEASCISPLIGDLSDADRQFFETVRYTQGMAAHYLLKREIEPRSIIFAADDPSKLLSYAQVPRDFPGFPGVPSRIWASLTPEYLEANIAPDGSNLDEITRPHVEALYPSLEEDLMEAHMQYEGWRLVLIYPGFIREMKRFLDRRKNVDGRYYFCGDYLAHPHTGGACASGKGVARQIIERFGQ